MATVTPPSPGLDNKRADWQRKVSDPLEKLRGYIRLYVSIEGAAVLLIYLALWFWIGLILDYGFFKVFTVDWVQVLPWGLRAGILVVLVSGLIALLVVRVTLRLMREFRDQALALVLERRFPKLLGDRLITAVELADTDAAARYGYSQAMIDQTVSDAAERVDQVPVNEAFNWKRLRSYLGVVVTLTLGLFVLAGAGYAAVTAVTGKGSAADYMTDFGNVSAIWFERNVLLQNTIWPRRTYLEIVNFPVDEDKPLTVGRNVGQAPVRVRALKWVYADKRSREGWRQLMWSDLNPQLLGMSSVPELPRDFFKGDQDWSLDVIDAQTERDDVRQKMNQQSPSSYLTIRGVIDQLHHLAAQPAMARTLRELDVPEEVLIYYKGDSTQSEQTLKREENNEYVGTINDLKETVKVWANAGDYWTRPRTIAVVPPPTLDTLYREEAQPAYLYHRVPVGGSDTDLKGLKQRFPRERVYLGGESSRIDVPAGTDIKLIGSTGAGVKDKDLEKVVILPRNLAEFQKSLPENLRKEPPADVWMKQKNVGPVHIIDPRTFEVQINNVVSRVDFDFEMTDTDGVVARRHVVVQPADDIAPEVEVGPASIVRKTPEGYMVTVSAMIPFEGRVRDDHGLDKLMYDYGYSAIEEKSVNRSKAILAAQGVLWHLMPEGQAGNTLIAPRIGAYVAKAVETTDNDIKGTAPLASFAAKLRDKNRGNVNIDELRKKLAGQPPQNPHHLLHTLKPEEEFFDVQPLRLKVSSGTQIRYRMRLKLAAADNNVETGPRLADSKETFTFVLVGETELLANIAKEEGELHDKLATQGVGKLEVFRGRLTQMASYLAAPDFTPDKYPAHAERSLQIAEAIASAALVANEVHREYQRIEKELVINRVGIDGVNKNMVAKVGKVLAPLEQALNNEFPAAEDAQRRLYKALAVAEKDPKAAADVPGLLKESQLRYDELMSRLKQVIEAMDQIKVINEIIKQLQALESAQRENVLLLKYLQKRLEDLIFGD